MDVANGIARIVAMGQQSRSRQHVYSLSTGATNPQVRKRAISSDRYWQMDSAKPLLHNIARTDLDDGVRQAAKDALTQIGGKVNDIVAAVMPFTVQGEDPK